MMTSFRSIARMPCISPGDRGSRDDPLRHAAADRSSSGRKLATRMSALRSELGLDWWPLAMRVERAQQLMARPCLSLDSRDRVYCSMTRIRRGPAKKKNQREKAKRFKSGSRFRQTRAGMASGSLAKYEAVHWHIAACRGVRMGASARSRGRGQTRRLETDCCLDQNCRLHDLSLRIVGADAHAACGALSRPCQTDSNGSSGAHGTRQRRQARLSAAALLRCAIIPILASLARLAA